MLAIKKADSEGNFLLKTIRFILIIILVPAVLYSQESCKKIDTSEMDQQLKQAIDGRYGCSVMILHGDQICFQKQYGYTDRSSEYQVDANTFFNVASISKSITALGILTLYEAGRLNLSDSLGHFFPQAPADRRGITIHQLLIHSAGFRQSYVSDGIVESQAALAAIFADTMRFQPGESFAYSSINYQLLGMIIEKISGEKMESYLHRAVLQPLQMERTHFWAEKDMLDRKRFVQTLWPLPANRLRRNWAYIGSGGIFTTADDLSKLGLALRPGKLFRQKTIELMLKPHLQIRSGLQMGYGWFINNPDGGPKEIWTRGTEDAGYNAVLRYFPEKELTIIVCSNSGEDGSPTRTANRILSNRILEILASGF